MERNCFGPVRTIQAVLPSMREIAGVIVNVSSAFFWHVSSVMSLYLASKHSLEGLSETLYGEVAPFDIRVLIAEPGNMRTRFLDPSSIDIPETPAAYEGTMADHVSTALAGMHGKQSLDPTRTAEAIVKEMLEPKGQPPVLRLPLGKKSLEILKDRVEDLSKTADRFESVALSADVME